MIKLLALLLSITLLTTASESPLTGKITFTGTKDIAGTYSLNQSFALFPSSPRSPTSRVTCSNFSSFRRPKAALPSTRPTSSAKSVNHQSSQS